MSRTFHLKESYLLTRIWTDGSFAILLSKMPESLPIFSGFFFWVPFSIYADSLFQMRFKDIDKKRLRDSGMALSLVCLIIVFLFKIDLFLFPAMVILFVTMACPIILKPFAFAWLNLSHYLGTGISNLLLIVFFFLLIIPVGVILKLLGKDSMNTKKWKVGGSASVMTERNHVYTSTDLKNPF